MAASVVAVGRRVLIWIVAFTAGLESAAQGLIAILWGRAGEVIVWAATAVGIFFAASQAEKIKWLLDE